MLHFSPVARITYLECTRCGKHLDASTPQTVCPEDGGVLYVRYDLQYLKQHFKPELLPGRTATMWRYEEVLPDVSPVTLGEGFTPIVASRKYPTLHVKDEGLN